MADTINKINSIPSIEQMTQQLGRAGKTSQVKGSALSFKEILEGRLAADEVSELKFSKHASERMQSRNIDLSPQQVERLEQGVSKAGQKGINESLVMVDDMAFIVNIKNSTVITAVNNMDEQVFTNIDGAVIA